MNINFPSLEPRIVDELSYIYGELEILKEKNIELINENNNLKIMITAQNKKLDIIHRLFNTYSKIVSENTRKIEKLNEKKEKELDLIQQIKNLENELFITKIANNDIKSSEMRNILNNIVNQ